MFVQSSDTRASLILGCRAHPTWAPARPTLAIVLTCSGFPTCANSRQLNPIEIEVYGLESGLLSSQQILDLRELARVDPGLAESADSRH